MSGDVVRLGGGVPFAHPGKPDANVIEGIRWLLERAEAGEIIGIAYAITYYDDAAGFHYVGAMDSKSLGCLVRVGNKIARALDP